MKEDHEKGQCHCCHQETMVRWKNIYHMGSEGLWVCMPCEMKIVNLVRELSRQATMRHKRKVMIDKGLIAPEDDGCIYCGAGDDIHHSYTCPTGLHPDRRG